MKILIYSPIFYPSIGGLEAVTSILAHEFVSHNHKLILVSQTPATDSKTFPFEVIRQPSIKKLLDLVRWCDVYFQPHLSLKGSWPLLISAKPWIVSHHGWYNRPDASLSWQDYLKHFCLRFATGISVSQAVADRISTPSTVIPNPYYEDIFYEIPEIERQKELIFVGRLVSDKGADLLLEALANLKTWGLTPRLTVVGSGPEEPKLRQQVQELGITEQVDFVGVKVEQELCRLLNAHKIMIVPSRWQEPFGIVALEGIACGCVIIGSAGGGLKDAIGPCGVTFPNKDVAALTQNLADLLTNAEKLPLYRKPARAHLSRHTRASVGKEYLKIFERVVR